MSYVLYPYVEFFHSLLRWGVLVSVAMAGILALIGYLRHEPIIGWHRAMALVAVKVCHVQVVVGAMLYGFRLNAFEVMLPQQARFWKYEHLALMVIAILIITIGYGTSKRTHDEQKKQLRIAVPYLIALLIFLWATPWPFTAVGAGRGWL